MLILIAIMITTGLCLAGDWPQFKRTANRQGCDLSEQVALPAKLCSWFDFGSPIRASAAIVANKAYAVSGRGLLARIDLATNTVDWHAHLGGVNNESSPAVMNGKVYVGSTDGNFFILDAETGAILKEYPAGAAILASPLLYQGGVYFGDVGGVFHALDMDGNLKWTFQATTDKPVNGSMNDGAAKILYGAAADSGFIVFPAGIGSIYWLADMGTRADTAYVYRWPLVPNVGSNTAIATPTIWAGSVYIGLNGQEESGSLFRFQLSGSARTSFQLGTVRTSPSIDTATQQVFFGASAKYWSSPGGISALGGAPNWRALDMMGVNSSPAVTGNCVIFGDENGKVYFLDKGAGSVRWSFALSSGKAIEASPAVSGGKVVVGSLDGCLYGFWEGPEVTAPVIVDSLSTSAKTVTPGNWTLTAFPNPISGTGVIFSVDGVPAGATLSIFSVTGALVGKLAVDGKSVRGDMKDARGRTLPAGTYFARITDRAGRNLRTFNIQVVR